MDSKKLKAIIIIIFILIIISIIGLVLLLTLKKQKEDPQNIGLAPEFIENYMEENPSLVTQNSTKTMFYSVQNCITNVEEVTASEVYLVESYQINKTYGEMYIAYALVEGKDSYYIINIDNTNKAFEIQKIEKNLYEKMRAGQIEQQYLEKKEIKQTANNEFSLFKVTDSNMSEVYLNRINSLILYAPETLYNQLDEEYKKERFHSQYSEFVEYCNLKKEQIETSSITSYQTEKVEDKKQYVCNDNYNNIYKIIEQDTINYTVMLDNYTIKTAEFKQKYEASENKIKAVTNLDQFIRMVNGKDYKNLYQLLDDTFKQNNFSTEQAFVSYMEQNFFDYNIPSLQNVEENSNNTFVYTITIKDKDSTSARSMNKTVVIRILEDTNFVMSFN